jgi:L-malate glycosyltransferase
MTNILYVSHTTELKGSAISLVHLINGISRDSYQPVVVFSKGGHLAEELQSRGIACHICRKRGFLGSGLIKEILELIDRHQISLVHLNSAVPFCKYVGIAAKIRRIPVVWHVREDPQGKRVRRLKKWIRLLSNRIFVVSSDLAEAFRNCSTTLKVYNGVDIDRFNPDNEGRRFREQFGIAQDALLFGMVGTIESRKGVILFLGAAESLLPSTRQVAFVIVGDGLKEETLEVQSFLDQRSELAKKTILTGRMQNIPEVMAAIDVLVMPSLWEGFPRSLIEAMASGRPAIASAVGEIPYIVDHGETGFVIPGNNPDSLASAMRMCVETPQILPAMGRRARERVQREFTIEKHIEAVEAQYRELLG